MSTQSRRSVQGGYRTRHRVDYRLVSESAILDARGYRPTCFWGGRMRGYRARIVALTAAVCCGVGAAGASAATTRYVATAAHGGSNASGNTCVSATSPCLTIGHAVSVSAAGDTIMIGAGRFPESITTTKKLAFVGAGSGTPTSFNASVDTFIDASATTDPGFSVSYHSTSFTGLRISGGVGSDLQPAIFGGASGSSGATVSVSKSVLLQANPTASTTGTAAPLLVQGPGLTTVSIADSTLEGRSEGVLVGGTTGALTVSDSTISTPATIGSSEPHNLVAAVEPSVPTTVSGSTVIGTVGVYSDAHKLTVTGTVIRASVVGVELDDPAAGTALSVRDSVIGPADGDLPIGVLVDAGSSASPHPSVDLTFDSVLARDPSIAAALDVVHATAGTSVHTRNTILHAITTASGSTDDIATGNQAIDWDLGYTDYGTVSGLGVPPPGSGTNISAPPLFVSDTGTDMRLSSSSTLFDKGDPSVALPGEEDVAGAPRVLAHTCDGVPLPDLGAYEAAATGCRPPTISLASPSNGATYTQGEVVTAAYACAAPAPGTISACAGPVPSGARISTSTPGSQTFTVTATTSDGATATATATYTVKAAPPPVPSLGSIHEAHKTWREGGKLASIATASNHRKPKKKPPVGTTFTFTLNTAATVKVAFTDRVAGRKVKRKCVAQSKHNKHDSPCQRTVTAGTLTLAGHAGTDKITFQGHVSKKQKLAPGGYTVTITATNATGHSRTRSTKFTIAKS
jgi:hypothetical protein